MQDHLEFVLSVVHGPHEFADGRVLFRREMLLHDAAEDGLAHRVGEPVEVVLDADELVGRDFGDVFAEHFNGAVHELRHLVHLPHLLELLFRRERAVFLKPLDEEILQEVTNRYRKIITIEEGTTTGGLGGAVAEWLADHNINVKLVRLGVSDTFVDQGTVKQLHEMCGLDAASIENKVKLLLKDTDL